MPADFKNRVKKFKLTALICCFPVFLFAQPVNLNAELDMLNGLQSNAVRVIQKDKWGRIWLGTYQGLEILNNSDPFLDSLKKQFLNKPVWALAFHKNNVFIGTRFNGLHVFDLAKHKLIQYFDSSTIGLCRKFRIINDTLYIATRANPFFIPLHSFQLHKFKSPEPNGFASDFTSWKTDLLAAYYNDQSGHIYQLTDDSMVVDQRFDLIKYRSSSLSVISNAKSLVIGGGVNLIADKNDKIRAEIIRNPETNKVIPAWDIELAGDRIFMAMGDPDNSQQGMIHEPFVTTGNDLNDNFYGLSLLFDHEKKGLWAGTENAGLFYWPAVNSYTHITKGILDKFKCFQAPNASIFLFDINHAYLLDSKRSKLELVREQYDVKSSGGILDVKMWNDTIAILTSRNLLLIRDKRVILDKKLSMAMFNVVESRSDKILLFSLYGDLISMIDKKTLQEEFIKAPSNQITTAKFQSGIFYHSTYTGFVHFDTTAHVFSPGFPSVESYAIANDTLWILNSGILSSYLIDLKRYELRKIREVNLKEQIKNFTPKWLASINNKIYCGQSSGFVGIDTDSNLPERYFYFGNFAESSTPKVFNDTLFFNHINYIAKLVPQDLSFPILPSSFSVKFNPKEDITENSPFIIEVRSNDYLAQKHSLKQITVIDDSNDSSFLYTTNDSYQIPTGLKRGRYDVIIRVNGVEVSRKSLNVVIPVTSNPIFYLAILLALMAFVGLWARYMINKRKYEKQILDNRLQLLKQNLNPHFVFNSLNLIYSLVLQHKNEAAIKTINNFSDLHRYYLENINRAKIKLKDELVFIESYLKLEAERREVDDPFVYFLADIPDNGKEYMVPPMILQPLVENAVKYCGPDPAVSKQSTIWVDISLEDTTLVISIENTVNANTERKMKGNGLGLKLVQERIEIYNKFFKEHLALVNNAAPTHSSSGYRAEIRI